MIMKSMFPKKKDVLTPYEWKVTDVIKYFQNSFFRIKKETLRKYKLSKDDYVYVLSKQYDDDFYREIGYKIEDEDEFEYRYWEDLPNMEVERVPVNVFNKEFKLIKERFLIDPNDLLLRKYPAGYFEDGLNLYLVYRIYNGHVYSKGVCASEYRVKCVLNLGSQSISPTIERGIFVDYPWKEKIIRRKIDQVVSLEKPFNILTKKYALLNNDSYDYPLLKFSNQIVGWFDTQENKFKIFVEGNIADKLRELYEGK